MEFTITLLPLIWGLLIGSFMNVVILRLPKNEDIVLERSGCPKCKNKIAWYDNIPILSYIILRGRCRLCRASISLQYPLIELIHGLLALYLFKNWYQFETMQFLRQLSVFFISSIFLAHIIIDFRYHLLLDKLNIALIPFVVAVVWIKGAWLTSLYGGLLGFLFPLLITWLFYLIRGKIGLGGGDIKLFGILGMLFGVKGVVLNLFTSCLIGSLITIFLMIMGKVKRDQYIPFGPYILIVALFQLLIPTSFAMWQNFLIPYY